MTEHGEGPLRVLYYYWFLQFDTGSPKVLVSMIDVLDRSRIVPHFWAVGEGPLVRELERRDVVIHRGPAGDVSWRRPADALRRIAGKVRALRSADIGLLHINEFGWNHDLAIAAWLLRIPIVLHVHNPLVVDRNNLHRRIAKLVLFVSQAHMEQTVHLHRIESRSRVLHNPIDIGYYASGRSLRSELGQAHDAGVVPPAVDAVCGEPAEAVDDTEMAELFAKHLVKVKQWLREQPHVVQERTLVGRRVGCFDRSQEAVQLRIDVS